MNDIGTYKSRLEEEKATLEKDLQDVGRQDASSPGEWEAVQKETGQEADPNDQASQLDEYQENRAIVETLNPRYRAVVEALARIEDGTYGTCESCGQEIEEERLEADPAAHTCAAHK